MALGQMTRVRRVAVPAPRARCAAWSRTIAGERGSGSWRSWAAICEALRPSQRRVLVADGRQDGHFEYCPCCDQVYDELSPAMIRLRSERQAVPRTPGLGAKPFSTQSTFPTPFPRTPIPVTITTAHPLTLAQHSICLAP